MGGMSVVFVPDKGALKKLEALCKDASAEAAEALAEAARERTPVDTGALRESCHVTQEGDEAAVSYDAPYALYVHEHTWVSHPVGQAKFLEDAAYDTGVHSSMLERCGSALRKVLG